MMTITGKCSEFGGPNYHGVGEQEGLALIDFSDLHDWWFRYLFRHPYDQTLGLARNLNIVAYYCAIRWKYEQTPRAQLRNSLVRVSSNGHVCYCRPVDWGPNKDTGRIIDLSPGALQKLRLTTDCIVTATLIPLL
ncbi:MAG: hypothetical protein ACREFF_07815 [Candidatus Udaeobacter sp.]